MSAAAASPSPPSFRSGRRWRRWRRRLRGFTGTGRARHRPRAQGLALPLLNVVDVGDVDATLMMIADEVLGGWGLVKEWWQELVSANV